ncbi:MAG: M28 family peptidase [Fidelibacterota bacterium]
MINNRLSIVPVLLFPLALGAQAVPEFDGNRAFGFLEAQCALGPRNPGSEGHRKGLEYIVDLVTPLADTVIVQSFSHGDPYSRAMLELTNVIAQFRPGMSERIWLSAHWDTRPWADRDPTRANRKKPILGANDGASGVAVLLELAQLLSSTPPPVGIDLLFLDGEDMGKQGDLDHFFNGSRYLVRNVPTRMPVHAIIVDMVGDEELELPIEENSWIQAPGLVEELWGLAESLGLVQFESRIGYSVADDHVVMFQEGGIPAVDIIDFHYPNRYTNYWHTLQDTPDKCSPESLQAVGTLLVHHIYGRGTKPQGVKRRYRGE